MTLWTRERAGAVLRDHQHFSTDGDDGPCGDVGVFDGDARDICLVRGPWLDLSARDTAELIRFVLNDYCDRGGV